MTICSKYALEILVDGSVMVLSPQKWFGISLHNFFSNEDFRKQSLIAARLVGKSEGRPESWLSRISGRMDLAFVNASEEFPEAEVYFVDIFSQTNSWFFVHKEVIPCSTGTFWAMPGCNQVIRHGVGCGGMCLCPALLSVHSLSLT